MAALQSFCQGNPPLAPIEDKSQGGALRSPPSETEQPPCNHRFEVAVPQVPIDPESACHRRWFEQLIKQIFCLRCEQLWVERRVLIGEKRPRGQVASPGWRHGVVWIDDGP